MEDKFHIGHQIKVVFDQQDMTVAEFARQIHCERTNVYTIFNRPSIDIELLARISKVLNHNFFEDVMNEYGLTPMFSPQLDIHLSMESCSREEADHLIHQLTKALDQNRPASKKHPKA